MRLSACLLLALIAGTVGAQPREFRAFAVAYKHEIDRSVSYDSFRAAIRQQFEKDIAPYLRDDVPNLVSYPENQTLMAYLVGLRGEIGRNSIQTAGAIAGLASLAGPYAPQIAYYQARFPGATAPGQLLQLGLTDTLARLVMETFGPLADEYDIYLSISSNLAPFERIEGPEAALLADPETGASHAYRATAPEIYNRNFIFGPDGRLLTIQDKAYLVPIEREQGAGLGLTGIETWQLPVFDLPFARVGTVISKDAWMPDVNDRLDQLGAELLIQPEAFSTWAVSGEDLWPPDKFQRGGWWMVQKHPAIAVNSTPMLTGNLGDLTFDGQPLLAREAGPALRCLMGQRPEPGWLSVGIWSDYVEPAALCDPDRRAELQEQGLAMQPGSGDARENLYADDVVFADIPLAARPLPAARRPRSGVRVQALDTGPAALLPRLSRAGSEIWLGWIDSFGERRQSVALRQYSARSGWGETLDLGAPATAFDHFDNQWSPTLLGLADGALLAGWTAFPTENWDLFASRIDAAEGGSGAVGNAVRVDDAEADEGVTRERGHSSPRLIAFGDAGVLALWSDLRWPWIKPQVRFALSSDGGQSWSASRRADGGPLAFEDEQLDQRDPGESRGQSFPDALVLPDGRLLIAWQEADSTGEPGIELATFDAQLNLLQRQRLSSGTAYRPRLAAADGTQWLIYEGRDAAGGLRLHWHSRQGGVWSAARRLDSSAVPGRWQRYAEPVVANGQLYVAYSDNRAGDDDLLLIRAGDAAPLRIDDAPPGVASLSPAALLMDAGTLMLVWQDETEQGPQLRWALQPLPLTGRGGGGGGLALLLAGLSLLGWKSRRQWRTS